MFEKTETALLCGFLRLREPYLIFVSAGVDMEAAKDLGVKVIWALGLPGKVAPVTAGNIIKETICNILGELGE